MMNAMETKLTFREFEVLKDLYGYYRMFGFKRWRMKTTWNKVDLATLSHLTMKGLARVQVVPKDEFENYAKHGKWWERILARIFLPYIRNMESDQYQITEEGIAYCRLHGVTMCDALLTDY